jgi:hypothetical protein
MESLRSSETSVLTRATRRNIPEDILHSHRREHLKSVVLGSTQECSLESLASLNETSNHCGVVWTSPAGKTTLVCYGVVQLRHELWGNLMMALLAQIRQSKDLNRYKDMSTNSIVTEIFPLNAANVVDKDLDIFALGAVSLNYIYAPNCK